MDQLGASGDVVDQGLALTRGPDAAVHIAIAQDILAAAGARHQFLDLGEGLGGVALDFENLLGDRIARDPRGVFSPFVLVDAIRREGVKLGINQGEYSWILEDNQPMRHILEAFGARAYKTYRVYEKTIAAAVPPQGITL